MSDKKPEIKSVIEAVREISPLMERICKEGSCYRFYELLKVIYPDAKAFYNDEMHVLTKIGDTYYDITGEVKPAKKPIEMTQRDVKWQKEMVSDLRLIATSYSARAKKDRDKFLNDVDSVV